MKPSVADELCFDVVYRSKCQGQWVDLLTEKDIPCSDSFSLSEVLGDPVAIRAWVLQMLPKDDFSISNAIIVDKSIRFPLFIDPEVPFDDCARIFTDRYHVPVCSRCTHPAPSGDYIFLSIHAFVSCVRTPLVIASLQYSSSWWHHKTLELN